MTRTPSNQAGLLFGWHAPLAGQQCWQFSRTCPSSGRSVPSSNDELRHSLVPSASLTARALRADPLLGSCLGSTCERAPDTGRANTYLKDSGTLPVELVRKASGPRVMQGIHAPAVLTPPVLTADMLIPHCTDWLNTLARHL